MCVASQAFHGGGRMMMLLLLLLLLLVLFSSRSPVRSLPQLLLEMLVCAVHPITNYHRIFYIALDPFPEGITTKPQTLNPKPQTPNPKPRTPSVTRSRHLPSRKRHDRRHVSPRVHEPLILQPLSCIKSRCFYSYLLFLYVRDRHAMSLRNYKERYR